MYNTDYLNKSLEFDKDRYIDKVVNFKENYNHDIRNVLDELIVVCIKTPQDECIEIIRDYIVTKKIEETDRAKRYALSVLYDEFLNFISERY